MSLLAKTKSRLQQLKSDPKRSLGQNFLVNGEVVAKIIEAVDEIKPAAIVEVGPGLGSLTDEVLALKLPLQLIELDQEFANFWRSQGVEVHEGDALKFDWTSLKLPAKTVLLSNLPYQISTHIVVDRTLGPAAIQSMVLMFQKEVAERLMAKPRTGDYGVLSVLSQSHWQIEKVVEAGPKSFFPPPKVASQVLKFRRLPSPVAPHEGRFLSFLKVAFAHRRKLLAKNLLAWNQLKSDLVAAALTDLQIAPKARAEELSVEQFVKLFAVLGGHGN